MKPQAKREALLVLVFITTCIIVSCDTNKTRTNEDAGYDLPELLISGEGDSIRTAEEWIGIRRPEILRIFQEEVYGKVPDVKPEVRHTILQSNEIALCGAAVMKEVEVELLHLSDTLSFTVLIYLPKDGIPPVPVFLGMNFYGNHTVHADPLISLTKSYVNNKPEYCIFNHEVTDESRGVRAFRWPVERILQRGYGLATIYYGDLDPDFDDGFQNGVHGLMDISGTPRDSSAWGSISAWAWGLSRAMDYFETDPAIDHRRVALIGHSRLGKTSLWAGAQDERFALVISNDSGCGGAALSRRKSGERLTDINTHFPHWFASKFHTFNGKEEDLPVDQHMLLALIAPRPLYVASAANDNWADPPGEYLSLFHAGEVYRLFGFDVFETTDMPERNHPLVRGRNGYHIRSGDHDLQRFDWEQYLDFADVHLKMVP